MSVKPSTRYSLSLFIGVICLASCYARPNPGFEGPSGVGENHTEVSQGGSAGGPPPPPGEMHGPGGPGGPGSNGPGMGGPPGQGDVRPDSVVELMESSGMPPPSFLRELNRENISALVEIKRNMNLTKGQIVSNTQNWLQGLPSTVQNEYAAWQSNITNWRREVVARIERNLSTDAAALLTQIQNIVANQDITWPATCQQIMEAINGSSPNATHELHLGVRVAGFSHMNDRAPPPPPMNNTSSVGVGMPHPNENAVMQPRQSMGGGHPEEMSMCEMSGHAGALHDGPGGHLSGLSMHVENDEGQE